MSIVNERLRIIELNDLIKRTRGKIKIIYDRLDYYLIRRIGFEFERIYKILFRI